MSGVRLAAIVSISLTVAMLIGAAVTVNALRPGSLLLPKKAAAPTPTVVAADASAGAACVSEIRNQVHIQPGTEPHIEVATQAPDGMWVVKVSLNSSESVRATYLCDLLPIPNSSEWQLGWLGRLQ
jgi:hypothetical protein